MAFSSVLQGTSFTVSQPTLSGDGIRWKAQKGSRVEVCRFMRERQHTSGQARAAYEANGAEKESTTRRTALLLSVTTLAATAIGSAAPAGAVDLPDLPELDLLKQLAKITEERQKVYADQDAKFQSSPILKELLKRSEENKQKNKQAIEDKYCIRGAELGIGDCALTGFTQEERDAFIEAIKKRRSGE